MKLSRQQENDNDEPPQDHRNIRLRFFLGVLREHIYSGGDINVTGMVSTCNMC